MIINNNSGTSRPLLTIDDPTIYKGEYEPFVNSVEVATTTECTQENVLYLVASGTERVPYVKTPTGVEILPNPFSRGPTLPYPNANNIYQLNDNLVAIDNHLYALRKELSYWNLYQISYSVDKADDLSGALASIGPGEALIINADGELSYEGQSYSRGDIILRLTDGTYITIKSSTSGYYYPTKVKKNGNNYTLYYRYWQDTTISDQATEITRVQTDTEEGLTSPYRTEYFDVDIASAADSFMYGIKQDMSGTNSYTFEAVVNGEGTSQKVIPPIIKFFTENGEEIAVDFTCTYAASGTQHTYTLEISSTSSKPSSLKYAYIK